MPSHVVRSVILAIVAIVLGFACGHAVKRASPINNGARRSMTDQANGALARAARNLDTVFGGHGYGGGSSYGTVVYGTRIPRRGTARSTAELERLLLRPDSGGTRYGGYTIDLTDLKQNVWKRTAPKPYAHGYVGAAVADSGTISGRVLWRKPPRAPKTIAACGGSIANRSLLLDGPALEGAVVFLEHISRGRALLGGRLRGDTPWRRLQLGGTLAVGGCELLPRRQLMAPRGSTLRVTRRGTHIMNLRALDDRGRPVFELALPLRGRTYGRRIDSAGFIEVVPHGVGASGAGSPTSAWIAVQAHPYYTLTDSEGRFALHDVPAGTYQLTVWHPPVILGIAADGNALRTAPARISRRVIVHANTLTRADLTLSGWRPAP